MSQTTPKFKSTEFKEALAALKETFDAHSLGIVLLDALERKSAEQIFRKHGPPAMVARTGELPKPTLCGQLTGWFFANEEVAFQVMKELDRACQKERHIVGSIPEAQAPERVGSYRAIALKRERAKFVWALSRDDRESVRKLAARIINQFFQEAADMEKARELTRGDSGVGRVEDVELARRLQEQAERLTDATEEVSDLKTKVDKFEEERARLLAEIGGKERMLKQAAEAREGLDQELRSLRSSLADVETKQREAELARAAEREARAVADDLAQKVRRLEKLAGAAETLTQVQEELEAANRRTDEVSRQLTRLEQNHKREREELDKERARLRQELEETREELRRSRKHVVELESNESLPALSDKPPEGRVLLLLDQANLAASAAISFKRKVDFASLISRLAAGRPLARAVAFLVDNGGAAFDSFCDTLRRSGWELRIKKPKRFTDGSKKADWDMGIAIEGIEQSDRAEIVVLVSGDGDFAPLVRHLKRKGRVVEVAAFADGLASELISAADRVHTLDSSVLE